MKYLLCLFACFVYLSANAQTVNEFNFGSGADLNAIKLTVPTAGNAYSYFFKTGANPVNGPQPSYVNYGINLGFDANSFHQLVFGDGKNEFYFRTYSFGFKGWNRIWHSGNFDPSTYLSYSGGKIGLNLNTSNPEYILDVQNVVQHGTGGILLRSGNSIYSDANNIALFSDGGFVFANANNSVTKAVITADGVLYLRGKNKSSSDIQLAPSGTSFFTGGGVAIGTSDAQGYKLAVNGSAIFTKAVVKNYASWPDYVFDPSYQLPSLETVSSFIKENKHLPEMPTASIIEKDGHDLGEVQKLLLKKMEEMTLYMIEQANAIKELKTENKKLNGEIEELKTQRKNIQ